MPHLSFCAAPAASQLALELPTSPLMSPAHAGLAVLAPLLAGAPTWYCSSCRRDTTRLRGHSTLKSRSSTCHAGAVLLRIKRPGRACGERGVGTLRRGFGASTTVVAARWKHWRPQMPLCARLPARPIKKMQPPEAPLQNPPRLVPPPDSATHRLGRRRRRERRRDQLHQAARVKRVLQVVEPRVARDAAGARGELEQAAQARARDLGGRLGQLLLGALQEVHQQVALGRWRITCGG